MAVSGRDGVAMEGGFGTAICELNDVGGTSALLVWIASDCDALGVKSVVVESLVLKSESTAICPNAGVGAGAVGNAPCGSKLCTWYALSEAGCSCELCECVS